MFTFETAVDTAVSTAKKGLEYIPSMAAKKDIENLVDAQAEYAKAVYNTNVELAKFMFDTFGKYNFGNFTAK